MGDINITIPLPVLATGQYFKVRYRDDPPHAWIDIVHQTNAPFTISGLSAGRYQLSATLVRSEDPLVECEEVIQWFEVVEIDGCLTATASIEPSHDWQIWQLQLLVTGAVTALPCGGYDIVYGIAGGPMSTVHYTSITGTILLPASFATYHVVIKALDCAGNATICQEFDVSATYGEGGCVHATVTHAELLYTGTGWSVKLTITQSAPPTNPFSVAWWQSNVFNANPSLANDPGGSAMLPASPTTTVLTFGVQPQMGFDPTPVSGHPTTVLIYNGTLADRCGWSTKWSASTELT
jgi:hypothetical protein